MLPDSKQDFPKCLYLDQIKWIDLARAHYGDRKGKPFQAALQAVRDATKSKRLVLPISVVNLVEATSHSDPERRERLARFMVDLSGNLAILPYMAVCPWEIKNAVRAYFSDRLLLLIRSSLIRRGIHTALGKQLRIAGLPPDREAAALESLDGPEVAVELLLQQGNARELDENARKGDEEIADICERARARSATDNLTPDQRYGVELAEYISKGVAHTALLEALQEAGITLPTFFDQLSERGIVREFFQCIYSLDVLLSLTTRRDRDLVRPIRRNDWRDMLGLSIAMPYCNLVVFENHWGHAAKALKLDEKYETVLITDACELPAQLAELGCI